jgi:hypothetical protein
LGREREATGQRIDAAKVPTPGDQVSYATATQQAVPFPKGKKIVIAKNPAEVLVEIGQPPVGDDVPGVLRPGLIAADFRLVVDSLTPRKRASLSFRGFL